MEGIAPLNVYRLRFICQVHKQDLVGLFGLEEDSSHILHFHPILTSNQLLHRKRIRILIIPLNLICQKYGKTSVEHEVKTHFLPHRPRHMILNTHLHRTHTLHFVLAGAIGAQLRDAVVPLIFLADFDRLQILCLHLYLAPTPDLLHHTVCLSHILFTLPVVLREP